MLPVRDIAKFGIIPDVDPFDLPVGAWSFGVNVRFSKTSIERAPVWRSLGAVEADPRFISVRPSPSGDGIFLGHLNGRVKLWTVDGETDYSVTGYSDSSAEATWSGCRLSSVLYANREDRVPWMLTPGGSRFTALSAWDSTWRARLLRSYNSCLVALNVTKNGVNQPNLIKTSDIVQDPNVAPATWDHTDPTTNAVENPLVEMASEITDACVLGSSLVIYGLREAWLMTADGSDDVYSFRRLPFDKGAAGANCSVEVNGKQYVFGVDDLWVHDGLGDKSIAADRVRDFVFRSIDSRYRSRSFVAHDANLKTVRFCYVSGDRGTGFSAAAFPNRAAVYDYERDRWSFEDLPLVTCAAMANVDASPTYASTTLTYETAGGTYQELAGGVKKALLCPGIASTPHGLTAKLYGLDLYGEGSVLAFPVDTVATKNAYLERDGIDLDEVGTELRGYKHVVGVYPQARIDLDAAPMEFSFGSADHFSENVTYSDYQTYDGRELYKLDYTNGGRYLAVRIRHPDYRSFRMSGMDVDLELTGGL